MTDICTGIEMLFSCHSCSGEFFFFFFPAGMEWQYKQQTDGSRFACFPYLVSNSFIDPNRKNTAYQLTEGDKTGHDCHVFCSQTKIIGTSETRPSFG